MKKLLKQIGIMIVSMCLAIGFTGCGQQDNTDVVEGEEQKTEIVAIETTPIATIVIKDFGTVTVQLEPEMAPNTVNNFITLANEGFYDGLIFHRVIEGFMIQGGDPEGIGTGGPGYEIEGEFAQNGFEANTLSHTKGTISMARSNSPDSAGSQFFIMTADGTYLDGQYAAFGEVIDGLDVVENIEKVHTDMNDKPEQDVVIESIRVDTNGVEVPEVVKVTE